MFKGKVKRNFIFHVLPGIPFVALIITGTFILLARFIDIHFETFNALSYFHKFAAVAWLIFLAITLIYLGSDRQLRNTKKMFKWGSNDLRWISMSFKFLFSSNVIIPDPKIFQTRQKINYLFVIFHIFVFAVSGFLMWFFNTMLLAWYVHVSLFFMTMSMMLGRTFVAIRHRSSPIGFGKIFHGVLPNKYLEQHNLSVEDRKETKEQSKLVSSFIRTDIILLIITILVGGIGVKVFNEGTRSTVGKGFSDIISPRELSGVHQLESIDDCIKCHDYAGQLKDVKCLECHKLVKALRDNKEGYHGKHLDKPCRECHKEHPKTKGKIRPFVPNDYDHDDSVYKLEDKHKKVACKDCHKKRKRTKEMEGGYYLGQKYKLCTDCHKDVHAGQFKNDACTPCHTIKGWRENDLKFDHDKDSKYKLEGKHKDLLCVDCHIPAEKDASAAIKKLAKLPKKQITEEEKQKKKAIKYANAQFVNMKFKLCTDCHEDVHGGQFENKKCTPCHTIKSWREKDLKFDHDKDSKYKLEDKHNDAFCVDCHLPGVTDAEKTSKATIKLTKIPIKKLTEAEKQKKKDTKYGNALFVKMKYALCTDCHEDIHGGQFKKEACTPCHTIKSWREKDLKFHHDKDSKYKLEDKHKDAFCVDCHIPDEKDASTTSKATIKLTKLPKKQLSEADKKKRRNTNYGNAQFINMKFKVCTDCHEDVHRGQFNIGKCSPCHTIKSWREKDLNFDHNKDSKYKLDGKHKDTLCVDCHLPGVTDAEKTSKATIELTKIPIKKLTEEEKKAKREEKKKQNIKYGDAMFVDMKYKVCENCHENIHKKELGGSCTYCHNTDTWEKKHKKK